MAVQPMIRQRWLEARRLRLLTSMERQRRSRVIALVHRQETMIHEFMVLFPQPARQRPSVEYIPLPYRARPSGPSRE